MKKLILLLALLTMAIISIGQSIQKGSLLGMHMLTVHLKPGVTMEQFTDFVVTKSIPETEKLFDCKGYLVKAVRGENNNSLALLWVFKSEAERNKYFDDTAEGGLTSLGKQQVDKLNTFNKDLEKLGSTTSRFTDWVVQ